MDFRFKKIASLFEVFLKDESIGGKIILITALLSLVIVNSPLKDTFYSFLGLKLAIGFEAHNITLDIKHWINEGLMSLFFLVVGLEIKRELVKGELRNPKNAILPIGAAIGGMAVPALIYLLFNINTDAMHGWGIPIATDIAFAVAVLSLLGKRINLSLKIFLLSLAIADDIGAILVIALFYAKNLNFWYLVASIVLMLTIYKLRNRLKNRLIIACILGVILWSTTHLSGIHASIVGAILGFMAPITKDDRSKIFEKIEKFILPITTFVILPLFALVNAGFPISTNAVSSPPILLGVIFGLVIGKVIGITLVSWILIRLNLASLPKGVTLKHIAGIGSLAGIGFTVSIFITELAFYDQPNYINTAKFGIFIASAISAILGYSILKIFSGSKPKY